VTVHNYFVEDVCSIRVFGLELCNSIDTTWYRNTKVGITTQNFGIEVSNTWHNQLVDDFACHFPLNSHYL